MTGYTQSLTIPFKTACRILGIKLFIDLFHTKIKWTRAARRDWMTRNGCSVNTSKTTTPLILFYVSFL